MDMKEIKREREGRDTNNYLGSFHNLEVVQSPLHSGYERDKEREERDISNYPGSFYNPELV